ncbi:hypothetical protein Tco_1420212 [Tanacetum coccineum]
MYEHCFRNLGPDTRAKLRESRVPLVGFSGEVNYPLGIINLSVTMGELDRVRTVIMEFAVVKCHPPITLYWVRLGVVAFTTRSMIKFPTTNGIATMVINIETLWECRRIEEAQGATPEGRVTHPRIRAPKPEDVSEKEGTRVQEMQVPNKICLRKVGPSSPSKRDVSPEEGSEGKDEPAKAHEEDKPPEKMMVNDDYLDQPITIEGNLSTGCRTELIKVLRKHVDAFAWVPADMTGIPRFVAEHQLKTYPHIEPRV